MKSAHQSYELAAQEDTEAANSHRQLFEKMEDGFISAEIVLDDEGRIIDWRFLEIKTATPQGSDHRCP